MNSSSSNVQQKLNIKSHLFILPVEARKVARWLWVRKGLGDKNTTYLKLTLPVSPVTSAGISFVVDTKIQI